MDRFVLGAAACREMLARFVEVGTGGPHIAESMRANWHPAWGEDPGRAKAIVPPEEGRPIHHYAVVSDHEPEPGVTVEYRSNPNVVHAYADSPLEAASLVSKMKADVYLTLGKLGSVRHDFEQAMLEYRASIRIVPVTTYGVD